MEILIAFVTFSALLLCAFGVFVFFAYQMYLSPKAIRRQGIRAQARADYEHARGTAHLRMLREGRNRNNAALGQCNQKISATENQIRILERELQERLRDALERYIVYTHLTEVKGIGPKMRERILAVVFRSRLADLAQAYRVQGVGAARQQAINEWIQHYTRQITTLLNEDFPGKREILASYRGQLDNLKAQLTVLNGQRNKLGGDLKGFQAPIAALELVGANDLVKALEDPFHVPQNVDDYMSGIFPEWDAIPDWFKDLTAAEVS